MCHIVAAPDGRTLYSTSVDAKGLRAWDTTRGLVWRSERLVVRHVYVAGLAILPRPAAAGAASIADAPLLATCAASMVPGTTYAAGAEVQARPWILKVLPGFKV